MLCETPEGWDGVEVDRKVQEGRDICMPTAGSCLCMTESNTMLKGNYPPIKYFKNSWDFIY